MSFSAHLHRILYVSFASILLSGCASLGGLLSPTTAPHGSDVASSLPGQLSATGSLSTRPAPYRRPPALPPPPLEVNAQVTHELRELLRGDAQCIRVSLERREPIKHIIEEIFLDEGIPLDLSNLAVIESRYLSTARSRAGAVGLWQFTRSTARMYGLKVDGRIDQRTEPILATLAAARHLRDLYLEFGDWYLALAAYNAGMGAVRKAVRRAQSTDFWEVAQRGGLSSQTRNFIPRFIAATILMRLAERDGSDELETRTERLLAQYGLTLSPVG